jgi:hypothetical protein
MGGTQLGRGTEQRIEHDGARQPQQQDRPPPHAIGNSAPDRRENELHGRKRRHQQAEDGSAEFRLLATGDQVIQIGIADQR